MTKFVRLVIFVVAITGLIANPYQPIVLAQDPEPTAEEKAETACQEKYPDKQNLKDACKDGYLNGAGDEAFCDKYTDATEKEACGGGGESSSSAAANFTPTFSPQGRGFTTDSQRINPSPLYDNNACGPGGSGGSAVGAETELTFPRDLDEGKMADVINKYVEDNKGPEGSILEGVGEKAVASAKKANVNPFLVIAQSKHESELGSKNNYNVRHGNNSFGRSAAAGQPSFQGSRTWYKWSSGEASVDHAAPENQGKDYGGDQYSYIRVVYSAELDAGDWGAYFEKYAPVSDNNANNIYHPSDGSKPLVQQEVEKMAAEAGGSGGGSSSGASGGGSGDECCAPSTTGSISGDTPVAKLMSYLTGKGLSIEIAAGFAGNFMQESGGGTFELDPKIANSGGYKGIAQWDPSDRYPKLVSLKGAEAETLEAQIWYVGYELGLESDQGSGRYKEHLERIKQNSDTVEAATMSVAKEYEGYTGEIAERTKYAQMAMDEYGDGAITPATGGSAGSCEESTATGDFVYYDQNDPKWSEVPDIAPAGCGPTSIAMIIATKQDKNVTPVEVAKFLNGKGQWSNSGIQWTGFTSAGEKWGMKVTELGKDWNKAKEALKAGKLLTVSGTGSEPFTSGGHIVVARGVTDDGKIIIANPAPMTDTPEETPYTTAELDGAGFANMWVYE